MSQNKDKQINKSLAFMGCAFGLTDIPVYLLRRYRLNVLNHLYDLLGISSIKSMTGNDFSRELRYVRRKQTAN